KRGSAVVDARTNTLFVQDTPSRLADVRRLIAKIDVPGRQGMIHARIGEANDSFSKSLGARIGVHDFSANGHPAGGNTRFHVGGSLEYTRGHSAVRAQRGGPV